jgi:threonine dehydrogenase-like Zn-dependent dehydrogenase
VKLPDEIDDDRAILLSDIFPTGYFAADLAEVTNGDTVAVFGGGPVGQFAIMSAKLKGADRVLAVASIQDRLEMARLQGAEIINFAEEAPVAVVRELTGAIGADRAIDAVGIDAVGTSNEKSARECRLGSKTKQAKQWVPGNAPTQAVAKAGTVGVVGVYQETNRDFPIGAAMNKNLALNMGNCHHRRYIPHLVKLVVSEAIDPIGILTKLEPLTSAIETYQNFDRRQLGWTKVKIEPPPNCCWLDDRQSKTREARKCRILSPTAASLALCSLGNSCQVRMRCSSLAADSHMAAPLLSGLCLA